MDEEWEQQKTWYLERQPLVSKDMELGRTFEPFQYPITEKRLAELVETTACYNPLYTDMVAAKREGFDGPIAPQAFAMIYGRLSFLGEKYRPAPGGIVTNLSFKFIKPPNVGDVVTSNAKVVANEDRKGRKYTTVRAESKNQKSELVSTMDFTFILPS